MRVNRTANASIYHVYKYFEKGSVKSKYRGPPKLTSKTAEGTSPENHKEITRT